VPFKLDVVKKVSQLLYGIHYPAETSEAVFDSLQHHLN